MEQSSLDQPTGTHAFTTIPRIIAWFNDEDVRVYKLSKDTEELPRLSRKVGALLRLCLSHPTVQLQHFHPPDILTRARLRVRLNALPALGEPLVERGSRALSRRAARELSEAAAAEIWG